MVIASGRGEDLSWATAPGMPLMRHVSAGAGRRLLVSRPAWPLWLCWDRPCLLAEGSDWAGGGHPSLALTPAANPSTPALPPPLTLCLHPASLLDSASAPPPPCPRQFHYDNNNFGAADTIPIKTGGEAIPYLYHIIKHYDRLPSVVIFTQASGQQHTCTGTGSSCGSSCGSSAELLPAAGLLSHSGGQSLSCMRVWGGRPH